MNSQIPIGNIVGRGYPTNRQRTHFAVTPALFKRYMVFQYVDYEAHGGIRDLIGRFSTEEEAKRAFYTESIDKDGYDWGKYMNGHIYDIQEDRVTWRWGEMTTGVRGWVSGDEGEL